MDIFDYKAIQPMRFSEEKPPFNSPDWIYELKLDGVRCLAYLEPARTDLRNKLNQPLLPLFPELDCIHLQANEKCILDGELIILKNGVPDFFELQCRLLQPSLTTPFQPYYPASFVAYDIIYYKDELVTNLPLIDRKMLLENILIETVDLAISRYAEDNGIELYQLAMQTNLEGIIAKRKNSLYHINATTKNWAKVQRYSTTKCVICGIRISPENKKCFVLGQYRNHCLIYKGLVDVTDWFKHHPEFETYVEHNFDVQNEPSLSLTPIWSEAYKLLWIRPQWVCSIVVPKTAASLLHKAVFRGLCLDVAKEECRFF